MFESEELIKMRAKLAGEAGAAYSQARKNDVQVMYQYLNPKPGEHILGFWEGNGFFCKLIAEALGSQGKYLVSDPSAYLLERMKARVNLPQVEVIVSSSEELDLPAESLDKAWSFGTFHDALSQTQVVANIYKALKHGGLLFIGDVFQGSSASRYFDSIVSKYREGGHEAKFLSAEFADSLCFINGFKSEKVRVLELPQKWYFQSENDIATFLYKILAMNLFPGDEAEKIEQTRKRLKDYFEIEYNEGMYELHWPMKALLAEK